MARRMSIFLLVFAAWAGHALRAHAADKIADRATLVVEVPANARLYINDQMTRQTGQVRTFNSPALEPGRTYAYKLVAQHPLKTHIATHNFQIGVANTCQ